MNHQIRCLGIRFRFFTWNIYFIWVLDDQEEVENWDAISQIFASAWNVRTQWAQKYNIMIIILFLPLYRLKIKFNFNVFV